MTITVRSAGLYALLIYYSKYLPELEFCMITELWDSTFSGRCILIKSKVICVYRQRQQLIVLHNA